MSRIDVYVGHLFKHKAKAVELVSGQPATFHLASGPRATKQVIKHEELMRIAQEVGPPDLVQTMQTSGRAEVQHKSEQGQSVLAVFESLNQNTWRLQISPSNGKSRPAPAPEQAAAPVAEPAAPAEAAAPAPEQAAAPASDAPADERKRSFLPPVQIEEVPGEPGINRYLRIMYAQDASDLHLCSNVIPMMRSGGEMWPVEDRPPFTNEELRNLIWEITPERNRKEFDECHDTDYAHEIEGLSRFRVNVFMDRNGIGTVMRTIPFEILSVDKLGLPPPVLNLCWLSKGLVLVTGPTGSGKSTTLAALIDFINENRKDHIITIEDPVEFVHPNKSCLVNQREIGIHSMGFKPALRAALREDPDIVLVGEMRDLETIAIAIETAETGHLVFGTLHTTSAISTIDRLIDQFPADRQDQIRVMLSESFRGAIAQVLCKKIGGGRAAGYEVLLSTPAVSNLIREGKTFQLKTVMQTGKHLGMQTMNDHLLEHVTEGRVTPEEAFIKCNEKGAFKESLEKLGIEIELKTDY